MATIYVVTDGDYSDYHIRGMYSTLEKAEYAKKLLAARNDVETFEIDAIVQAPKGMFFFRVGMDEKGECNFVELQNASYRPDFDWQPYGGSSNLVVFYMWANDEKHAVKIANEKRACLLANYQWTTDWNRWKREFKQGEVNG